MAQRDFHTALKTGVEASAQSAVVRMSLARLQWGKDEIGFSLHVEPHTFCTAGLQATDFLSYLGFARQQSCPFTTGHQCYAMWVDGGFELAAFGTAFDRAFAELQQAERQLGQCGLFLKQPEGWGFFSGNASKENRRGLPALTGDGHTAATSKELKRSEDEAFLFRLTWLETIRGKGWTMHYHPKHPPLSAEMRNVFSFLEIKEFKNCPEFDFDQCHWRSFAFQATEDTIFNRTTEAVHSWFDAHAHNFSEGIRLLLSANAIVEGEGMRFLPIDQPAQRLAHDLQIKIDRPQRLRKEPMSLNFDVAISFAGTEREHAERLATALKEAGYSVFYDDFYQEFLWGKNLVDTFDEIYRRRSRYCVMFISKEYADRVWTNHERQSAQARALQERGREYILPIRVDDTELAGLPPTLGYVSISAGVDKIAELLIAKLSEG